MISLLIHSATIQQLTSTQLGTGTFSPTYATRISGLACRVQGMSVTETDEFGKKSHRNVYRLYCMITSATTLIDESDRVVWDSRTFEITGIKDGGAAGRHYEIDLLEVK